MSELNRVFQGFVAAEPLHHDGERYAPGMPIDLTDEQAKPLLARGLIQSVWRDVEPDTAPGEPLPELPESAYPADAQPIPTEPEPGAKTRKGAKA